jgi:hypothetical protein
LDAGAKLSGLQRIAENDAVNDVESDAGSDAQADADTPQSNSAAGTPETTAEE